MSLTDNSKLKEAISELKKTIESSLGEKNDCNFAITEIEGTLDSIEKKLLQLDNSSQLEQSNIAFAGVEAVNIR